METKPELALEIDSRFDDLELVDALMETACSFLGIAEPARSEIALAVREAAANAVRHGHRLEAGRRVTIDALLGRECLTVKVRDHGEGFDPASLPDPLDPSNLLKPTGRGVFLMRQFMDRVSFDFPPEGGTVVVLEHRLSRPRPPEEMENRE